MNESGATIRPPSPALLLLEGRALLELAAMLPTLPLLRRAPRGDGHPVLVLPPFIASDLITRPLRGFLRDRGYRVHGWKLGRNLGPSPQVALGMAERLAELRARYQRRVSLIGWSLGGVYARELARRFPEDVRLVITLGSPFRNVEATNVPRVLRAFGKRRSFKSPRHEELAAPLSVPATAIVSRTDAIAPWQGCIEDDGPISENIEVGSSHIGLGPSPGGVADDRRPFGAAGGGVGAVATADGMAVAARAATPVGLDATTIRFDRASSGGMPRARF